MDELLEILEDLAPDVDFENSDDLIDSHKLDSLTIITLISDIEDEFDVKIFGVVQKGEATKEIQVYGEGATGVIANDGTFSLVVKGASYTDEFKFSVRVEITCKDDDTKAESVVTSKNLTTAADGIVSTKDVASYFLAPNRVDALDQDIKKFYETIVG